MISRRDFLKFSGLLASSSILELDRDLGFLVPSAEAAQPEKEEKKLYGVCGVCSMGCAYIAYVQNGWIVRLEGNPRDQIAEGKLCVKGRSSLNILYDPDRLKYPMKRTNPKKGIGVDPKWVKISWDEAIGMVATKFKEIIAKDGPQAIVIFARAKPHLKHFVKSIGTPNLIVHSNACDVSHDIAWESMVTGKGKGRPFTVDYENSRYILSFGWDGPGKSKNKWGRAVNNALEKGARLVVFDPRLSITASKAHEWIPIKPGTDLAVLLAMIRTIIIENLFDHEFISKYTIGFNELKGRVQQYTPEWAEKISDVPAGRIVRIAREFATTKPAVVASHKRDAGGPLYSNSFRVAQCFIIMNTLVGSIDRPGGRILDRKPKLPKEKDFVKYPEYPKAIKERIDGMERYPLTKKGNFFTVAQGILSKKPYPVKAALFWKYNLPSFPNRLRLEEALKTLDFIAVSDIYPTELTELADVVLPEGTFFEGKGLKERKYHAMYPQMALVEGIKPLYDTKGFKKVLYSILKKMALKEYVPDEEALKAFSKAKFEALGTTKKEIHSNGGIWTGDKEFKPKTEFGTPSKKIEFTPSLLKEKGFDPLPYWIEPKVMPNKEYPYRLIIYRTPWQRMMNTQNIPVLIEIYPENTATIYSKEAEKLNIKDGDYVWVESTTGKIKVKAHPSEGIRSDCVAIDHSFGHRGKGMSVAFGKGSNEGDLVPDMTIEEMLKNPDPSANVMWNEVVVKVSKA